METNIYNHTNAAETKIPDNAYDHLTADMKDSAMIDNADDVDHYCSTALVTGQTERLITGIMNDYSHLKHVTNNSEKRSDKAVKDDTYLSSAGAVNQSIKENGNAPENNLGEKEYDHLHVSK